MGIYQGVKTEIDSYLAASGKRYKGDWFIWGGLEDTSVTYAGVVYSFKVSCAYIWNGISWGIDDNPEHNSEAFNDIIGVANDMLENNNATANLALNRLVSNTVFCKRLVAATAFIQNLFTKNFTIENGGSIKSQNYNGKIDDAGNITSFGTRGFAIDHNGKADFVGINVTDAKIEGDINCSRLYSPVDVFEPMLEFSQNSNSATYSYIDLNTMSVDSIKDIINTFLNASQSSTIGVDYNEYHSVRAYVSIFSTDKKMILESNDMGYYIQRYIEADQEVYELGSVGGGSLFIQGKRTIIKGDTKFTSSVLSNKFYIGYIAKELSVNAITLFAGHKIESRSGYQFTNTNWSPTVAKGARTQADYWKLLYSKRISEEPRLCAVGLNNEDKALAEWNNAVVWKKDNNNYIIRYGTTTVNISASSTSAPGNIYHIEF